MRSYHGRSVQAHLHAPLKFCSLTSFHLQPVLNLRFSFSSPSLSFNNSTPLSVYSPKYASSKTPAASAPGQTPSSPPKDPTRRRMPTSRLLRRLRRLVHHPRLLQFRHLPNLLRNFHRTNGIRPPLLPSAPKLAGISTSCDFI
jgi:hypothetical protein